MAPVRDVKELRTEVWIFSRDELAAVSPRSPEVLHLTLTMNTFQAIFRLRQVIRLRHMALATEESYVFWLRRYVSAVHQMPKTLVSKQPVHMRRAPSMDETLALLQTVPNVGQYPTNLIARMLYGCGLRVSEPLNLRIKDVDLRRCRLCIRGAKGGNDRMVALPSVLLSELLQQMNLARAIWQQDLQNRTPVMLPHGLRRSIPNTSSVGNGRGCFHRFTPAEIIGPDLSFDTGCMRPTYNALSSKPGVGSVFQCCRMNCGTVMQRIA